MAKIVSTILAEDNEYLVESTQHSNNLQNETLTNSDESPSVSRLLDQDGTNNIDTTISVEAQMATSTTTPTIDDTPPTANNDDEDGEDEDEINEPKFTYDRIGNHFTEITEKDSATCLTLHERFLALGTQSGKVYIFDFQGNIVAPDFPLKHSRPVNAISIDEKGEYVASCSDFQVIIVELYSNETLYVTTFVQPVKCISIDPQFANSGSRRFALGEADRFLLFEKNILGRYKSTSLQQARGGIRRSTWRTHFLAWASDLCVKIYDTTNRTIITHIDRQKSPDYRIKSDVFQCSFCWRDNRTLLLCWGTSVQMCCIKQRPKQTHESMTSLRSTNSAYGSSSNISTESSQPKLYVELVYAFNIEESLVGCGIAPYESRFLILCTNKTIFCPQIGGGGSASGDKGSGGGGEDEEFCRIKMVEPLNADIFNDMSDDILQPKEFLSTIKNSRDITMSYLPEERFYFILCPKDLILAKQRDEDDHINWLMMRGNYSTALARVQQNLLAKKYSKHSIVSVGTAYIQHLFGGGGGQGGGAAQGSYDNLREAASLCVTVCGTNQTLWEREVMRFKQRDALRLIASYLPTGPDVVLEKAIYELVLKEYLHHDSQGFLTLIREWPPAIYSAGHLINATIEVNATSQDVNLQEALAELYINEREYRKALFIFLQVGNSKKVFDLIYSQQLLYLLEDRIIQLLELDAEETSRLLILHQDSIPSEKVISRLNQHPKLLCAYLDRLVHRDPAASAQYHDLMFDLYCSYLPEKVVPLLRQSSFIQLDKALEACRKRNLPKAVVFILGRMGATHEALRIIIDKMNDINAAIEFCREHGDPDLWAELMDISVSNPKLLSTLLQEVSTYAADPIGLIARIPEGMEVPNLMPSLVKILQDYRLQVTLENGCCSILRSDCYNLLAKHHRTRSNALAVRNSSLCQSCQHPVLEYDPMYTSDVLLFQCGHVFHETCLVVLGDSRQIVPACTVCRAQVNRAIV